MLDWDRYGTVQLVGYCKCNHDYDSHKEWFSNFSHYLCSRKPFELIPTHFDFCRCPFLFLAPLLNGTMGFYLTRNLFQSQSLLSSFDHFFPVL